MCVAFGISFSTIQFSKMHVIHGTMFLVWVYVLVSLFSYNILDPVLQKSDTSKHT